MRRRNWIWMVVATFAICHPQEKGQICPDRTVGAGRALQVVSRGLVCRNRREDPLRGPACCRLHQFLYLCLKVQQAL